jgi:hypothetical protein
MLFSVVPAETPLPSAQRGKAFLIRENWDDWDEFETLFLLAVFDLDGNRHDAGAVKIGQLSMEGQRSPQVPAEFDTLDERFFSLGQDENYYETLLQLGGSLGSRILQGLRDVAQDLSLYERARHEPIMERSLMRFVSNETVQGRFHRLAQGDARLTGFKFAYELASQDRASSPPLSLAFEVRPGSRPPTNIHVLIGSNGAGKTRCLTSMARSLVRQGASAAETGVFTSQGDGGTAGLFANLVSVTFSAFDPFGPEPEPHSIRYAYVGLRQAPTQAEPAQIPPPKTLEQLTQEFVKSAGKCRSGARALRWRRALETIEVDPLFKEEDLTGLLSSGDSEWEDRARQLYERLSSGHKIVLLTLTRLVETVDERTLVLLDEPESHLHPPLLAAFVRSLSELLTQRNGVAIIATHSPVVLQEAPRACVWLLRRSGTEVRASRPELETFGENVGVLTREAFGLEVTQAGFHQLLKDAIAAEAGGYEAVLEHFGSQLGAEARVLARGLIASREATPLEDNS